MVVRRRLRSVFAVSAALLLVSVVLVSRSLDAATGSDIDASVTVDDAQPLVGSTIDVGLAGLDPLTAISVQLCVGFVSETPLGQPLTIDPTFIPGACRVLGELTTDANGAASGPVTLPADGVVTGGLCTYDSGASSLSFATMVRNTCTIAAVTDTDTADGITPLASTRVAIRSGAGSISGALVDDTGQPLSDENYVQMQVCPVGDYGACQDVTGAPLFEQTGPSYRLDGLADGTYTVVSTAYTDTTHGSDLRTVTVAGGEVTADLRFPSDAATSAASPGVDLAVAPAAPIEFDDTIQVTASGFAPGDQIEAGLCSSRPALQVFAWAATPRLISTCTSVDAPVTAVADASGTATIDLPYTPERFTQQCYNAFADGSSSFSFGSEPQPCYLEVLDVTGAPSYAWQQVEFLTPAGAATVGGVVRADGSPIAGSSVALTGPIGGFWKSTGAAGDYAFNNQPDGPFSVTANLPTNYYYQEEVDLGPGSFSFGYTRNVTVEGAVADQQNAVADVDFDIEPGSAKGTVLRADGSPAVGVYVSIQTTSPSSTLFYGLSDTTLADGAFEFYGLPAGSYQVVAYDYSSYSVAASTTFDVGAAAVEGIQVKFPSTNSSISGTVVDANGSPVAGAWVSACQSGSVDYWWYGCRSAVTGADGGFSLAQLSAGDWRVTVYSSFNYLSQTSTTVSVAEDENLGGVQLTLPVDTGGISGSILDENGAGVPGASVYACSTDNGFGGCAYSTSGPGGAYAISGAPDGSYTVSASASGYIGRNVGTTVSGGEITTGVDLQLRELDPVPPLTSVGGVDGDTSPDRAAPIFPGQPTQVSVEGRCTGATVAYELRGEDDSLWASGALAESDSTPGDYAGSIPPQSGRSGRGVLSIAIDCPPGTPDPEPVQIDVYIDPSGTVVDTNGAPVAGATVTLLRADTEAGPFEPVLDGSEVMSPENRTNPDLTDDTGAFGWLTVPGFYKVRAEKDGCQAPGDLGSSFVETPPLPVPPEQVGLELVLDCSVAPPLDTTGPEVTLTVDDDPNADGWTSRLVPVSAEAVDEESGVASVTLIVNGTDTEVAATVLDDGEYQVSARAVDGLGNVTLSPPVTVKVDTVDPDIVVTSPTDGQSVTVGASVLADYSCQDAGSGIAACEGDVPSGSPLDTSAAGTRSFTVSATDRSGRTNSTTVGYTVVEEQATDTAALRFTGSLAGVWDGDPTSGDIRITRAPDGKVQRISGRVQVPGRDGGTATIRVDLRRIFLFDSYLGSISVVDRDAKVNQATPVVFGKLRESPDGLVSGQTSWFGPRLSPYRLAWTFGDAG